jgi:hypothetical protein
MIDGQQTGRNWEKRGDGISEFFWKYWRKL